MSSLLSQLLTPYIILRKKLLNPQTSIFLSIRWRKKTLFLRIVVKHKLNENLHPKLLSQARVIGFVIRGRCRTYSIELESNTYPWERMYNMMGSKCSSNTIKYPKGYTYKKKTWPNRCPHISGRKLKYGISKV